jgi:hypothetical protein
LDRTVASLNIEHYKKLLATETDESRRQLLLRLLAEEEKKIAHANPADARAPRQDT